MKNRKPNVEGDLAREEKFIFRLFIMDNQPNSARAVINIKMICDQHLEGRYELDVIDLSQKPNLALSENIIAVPILIKKFPLPEIRLIGDLSDTGRVLEGLSFFN
jgi:circadian clock protein KaiB